MEVELLSKTTYALPAEWSEQSGVMLTWPHQESIWAETLDAIDQVFVRIAHEISLREKVLITCFDSEHQKHIRLLLKTDQVNLENIKFYIAPSDDVWVRDHGPLITVNNNKFRLLDFCFNGWGNKYPADKDNKITRVLQQQNAFSNAEKISIAHVLEGGSIEVDGEGSLLTTSSCLLSTARNPNSSKDEIAGSLKKWFGVDRILWLDHGYLAGDDTDGHIDTLARFIDPQTICYVQCLDPCDEHYAELKAMEKQLQSFRTLSGHPYKLIPLPWPTAHYADYDNRRLPLSYANFLIINDAVLVPTYQQAIDMDALNILAVCFPDRKIIGIDCLPLIQWNGGIHCVSMQLPQGILI